MIWSTFTEKGYVQAIAYSDNGEIDGNWHHEKPMFDEDGGHGMIFDDYEGNKYLILHSPNENPLERPVLFDLKEENDTLYIVASVGGKEGDFRFDGEYIDILSGESYKSVLKLKPYELRIIKRV